MPGRAVEPKNIAVRVMTCPREPMYAHEALANLYMSGPEIWDVAEVRVFIDADTTDCMRAYRHLPHVQLHARNAQEQADWQLLFESTRAEKERNRKRLRLPKHPDAHKHVHWRFNHSLWTILRYPLPAECKGLFVMEDDVYVRSHAIDHLCDIHSEMLQDGLTSFVVTLQDNHGIKRDPERYRGANYSSSPAGQHYGTVGIYYSVDMVAAFRDYIHIKGVQKFTAPGDMLLKELIHARQNFYVSGWDLVSHEGIVSTGLGGGAGSRHWHVPWRALTKDDFGAKK